jgi:hypothetical protein
MEGNTYPEQSKCIGLEVIIAVVMKRFFFWNITLSSSIKVDKRFGEIC